jgi:hypothetical protein
MRSFSIAIPKPCTEKWDNFSPAPHGGHCASCKKVVVDFTGMTDDKVLEYFNDFHDPTCGRFRPSQLKLYAHEESIRVRPGIMLFKAGLVSLLLALISKPAVAQEKIGEVRTEVRDFRQSDKMQPKAYSNDKVISGIVMARGENEALPGVTIVLQGTNITTTTDINGGFEFPQRLKEGDVLVFYAIGMEANETELERIQVQPLKSG